MPDGSAGPNPSELGLTSKDLGINQDTGIGKVPTKPQVGSFLEQASEDDKTPIIGGQIITPTARLAGETDDKAATERGWLRGIDEAFRDTKAPETQRQSNVQVIVDEAIKAGIPREKIGEHLSSLGINAVERQATSIQPVESTRNQVDQTPLDEATTKNALDYIGILTDSVTAGRSNPRVLRAQLQYLERRGVPREQLEEILRSKGITPSSETENPQNREGNRTEELDTGIQNIVNKLATRFPEQPGGIGRIGYEVNLTSEELAQLRQFLQITRQRFDTLAARDSNFQALERFIAENRGKNTSLAVNLLFGKAIQEDPNSKVISTGAVVTVPSETYRLWLIKQNLEGINVLFNTGKGDSLNSSFGRSTTQFEAQLRALLNFSKP